MIIGILIGLSLGLTIGWIARSFKQSSSAQFHGIVAVDTDQVCEEDIARITQKLTPVVIRFSAHDRRRLSNDKTPMVELK